MNHSSSPVEGTPSVVLGLLAAAGAERFPGATWPIEAALEQLELKVEPDSTLGRTLGRWPKRRSTIGTRFANVAELLRDLARNGAIVPDLDLPGYAVTHAWRQAHIPLLHVLTPKERTALETVGQRVVARVTRLSKRPATAGSSKSRTTTSSTTRHQALTR
jgi:hypothetical protein